MASYGLRVCEALAVVSGGGRVLVEYSVRVGVEVRVKVKELGRGRL